MKSDPRPPVGEEPAEGPPPFLKTWPRLYALVLGELALCIVLFYIFTRAFA
ncbi:MAG: hypothetical protein JXQ27_18410 [Acidobacteria bacterium]|nr:hypothetical protein [Acidobacteriota bacterium]